MSKSDIISLALEIANRDLSIKYKKLSTYEIVSMNWLKDCKKDGKDG
jgi:hypothetical protein